MGKNQKDNDLPFVRFMMVLSSFSPLFILWAFKGNDCIPDIWLWSACTLLILIPTLVLYIRIRIVKKINDVRTLKVGNANNHSDHILVYLFAMLLPFYSDDINSLRSLISTIVALIFVVFLFLHLRLHYMNFLFAITGKYHTFSITLGNNENALSGKHTCILITKRSNLIEGEQIDAYRLSNTVFMEKDS